MVDREAGHPEPALPCQVLRCQGRATRVFLVEKSRWGHFETVVCGPHSGGMRSGALFTYNSGENVLCVGTDATVAHQHSWRDQDLLGPDLSSGAG